MAERVFGRTPEGNVVRAFDLSGGGLTATVIEYGAILQDLRLDGLGRPLTLGYARLEDYLGDDAHVGAVVGRVANRLSGGRFSVAGRAHRATRNVRGTTTLHGGARGWGRRVWRAVEASEDAVVLALHDPDGAEGFPGAVEARASYRLRPGALEVAFSAAPDAPTVVNMTHHAYFNLSPSPVVDGHRLQVFADRMTPLGPDLCPTGKVVAAAGDTDWRGMRALGAAEVDVNYVLADAPRPGPAPAARVEAEGVALTMLTDAPGVQVYTGHNMRTGADFIGRARGPRAGLCLEPQHWPDAPNHPGFPSIEATPERPYAQRIRFELGFT